MNIDYKMREDIVDQLKYKMDATVFTQAQHQIYTLMHRDSYPRFLSSPILAELTAEIMGECTPLWRKHFRFFTNSVLCWPENTDSA